MNAAEFNLLFDVRPKTAKDVANINNPPVSAGRGRPKTVFKLEGAHPLIDSHLIVRRHKSGVCRSSQARHRPSGHAMTARQRLAGKHSATSLDTSSLTNTCRGALTPQL